MDELPAEPQIADSLLDLVGNTPLVRLGRVTQGLRCRVVAKLEVLGLRKRTLVIFTGDNGTGKGIVMPTRHGLPRPAPGLERSDGGGDLCGRQQHVDVIHRAQARCRVAIAERGALHHHRLEAGIDEGADAELGEAGQHDRVLGPAPGRVRAQPGLVGGGGGEVQQSVEGVGGLRRREGRQRLFHEKSVTLTTHKWTLVRIAATNFNGPRSV